MGKAELWQPRVTPQGKNTLTMGREISLSWPASPPGTDFAWYPSDRSRSVLRVASAAWEVPARCSVGPPEIAAGPPTATLNPGRPAETVPPREGEERAALCSENTSL